MKPFPLLMFALAVLPGLCGPTQAAQTWYDTGAGDDTHTGTTAFRSLKKAETRAQPGDTVLIGDGTHTDADTNDDGAVVTLSI